MMNFMARIFTPQISSAMREKLYFDYLSLIEFI